MSSFPARKGVKMKRIAFVVPMLLATSSFALADPPAKQPTPKAVAGRAIEGGRQVLPPATGLQRPGTQAVLPADPQRARLPPMNKGFTTRKEPFSPQVQITEEQAKKLIDYLAAEGFLDRAAERKPEP